MPPEPSDPTKNDATIPSMNVNHSLPVQSEPGREESATHPNRFLDSSSTLAASDQYQPPTTRTLLTPSANLNLTGYDILQTLGEGGMGKVYKAREIRLNRIVAIKMIRERFADSESYKARFMEEAQAVAELHHPNIVQLYGIGDKEGLPYFTLEYIAGCPLSKYIKVNSLQPQEAAAILLELARAMAYAHIQQLVHRDLKPDNILLQTTQEGDKLLNERTSEPTLEDVLRLPISAFIPKITDFGIAKRLDLDEHTKTGAILGTPGYMSPEQAGGKTRLIGPLSDVYTLGVILYELLTRKIPFKADSFEELVQLILHQEPTPPSNINPKVPKDLETICLKCLQKSLQDRYASANDLADDLQRFLEDEPIKARPTTRAERFHKWLRRNPVMASLITLTAFFLLAGVVGIYLQYREAKQHQIEADKQAQIANQQTEEARRQTRIALENEEKFRNQSAELAYQLGYSNLLLSQVAYDNRDVRLALERIDKIPVEQRKWEWDYLRRYYSGGIFSLSGHTDLITWLSWSPDGYRVLTCSVDNTLKMWDARSGMLLYEWRQEEDGIWCAAWSPDGSRIVSGSERSLCMWDVKNGNRLMELKGHVRRVYGVDWSSDGKHLVTASADKTVKIWAAHSGKLLQDIPAHQDSVRGVAFHPDGQRVVSASADRTAKIWDVQTGKLQLELTGHEDEIYAVRWNPDGSRIATASDDTTVRIWDATSGKTIHKLQAHSDRVWAISWSPDGTRLASGSWDATINIWDANRGQILNQLKGATSAVVALAWSPDAMKLVAGSNDTTVKVWDVVRSQAQIRLEGHTGPVVCVAVNGDGSQVVTGSNDKTAKVWDVRTGQFLVQLTGHKDMIWGVAWEPNGYRIATVSDDQTVKLWDARSGRMLNNLQGHTRSVRCVCWTPDGTRILTGSDDKTIKIWEADTGKLLQTLNLPDRVFCMACSPDNKTLVAGSSDKIARIWDLASGTLRSELKGHTGLINGVDWSPDSSQIVTASWDNSAKIWDAATAKLQLDLRGHTVRVNCVRWSPDGSRIATVAWDNIAKIWDPRNGQPLLDLRGHATGVIGVAWTPDGKRIVTASWDGTAKIWESLPLNDLPVEETLHRLIFTRGDRSWHQSALETNRREKHPFAVDFHLGRLLELASSNRLELLRERMRQRNDPIITARTLFHSFPEEPNASSSLLLFLAMQRHPLATRLWGQHLLQQKQNGEAIVALKAALDLRSGFWPPVEELLLALAYQQAGQIEEAAHWYRVASSWLDRFHEPLHKVQMIGFATAGLFPMLSVSPQGVADPRYNPFDWERWYECQVFRNRYESRRKQ